MHNASYLKAHCMTFIAANDQVMLTEGWELMGKARCELMIEVCRAIALKNKVFQNETVESKASPFDDCSNKEKSISLLSAYRTKSWSRSKVTSFNIEHIWKIDLFSDKFVPKNPTKIESTKFSASGHDIEFQLSICPQTPEKDKEKLIELNLEFFPGTIAGDASVNFDIAILKEDGNVGKNEGN